MLSFSLSSYVDGSLSLHVHPLFLHDMCDIAMVL